MSGSSAPTAARTYSPVSPRPSRSMTDRSRTTSISSRRCAPRAAHSSASGIESRPSHVAGSTARSVQPSPRWRSSSSRIGPPIHVGMCAPLVTEVIGTSSTSRSGHMPCHISRATSPWRALPPLATPGGRSANRVTPHGPAASSRWGPPPPPREGGAPPRARGGAPPPPPGGGGPAAGRGGVPPLGLGLWGRGVRLVARRHGRVRREDGPPPHRLEGVVERRAAGHLGAHELQAGERRVALVEVH